ncbi:MAG: X-Pro dipeptidyl-peptidase [Chloroflexota bacterium]|jgi:X-Pro dipeptidyl-peptidase|nr:X-Pro dipeptidyl-peptidase [Chloroflexota bacterium]
MFGALAPVAARPAAAATYTTFHFTNVKVPMRDGVKLEVNIWAPDVPAGVKVPVILTLSPYNILNFGPGPTDGTTLPDTQATWFVPRGYARAFADVRGTRNSEGCYDYGGLGEQHDGYDLVEWLGTQPWSNGSVGMVGTSYEGTTANAAAAQHPPHLKAIVPIASINKWYDYAYELGTRYFLNSEHATDEGIDTPAGFTYGFGIIPPFDPAGNPVNVVTRISPCDRVAQDQHGYNPQPDYDQYWKDRDYLAAEGTSGIPTWIVHGVLDSNVRTWEGTQVYAGTSAVRKLWLGQWPHADGSSRAGPEWQRQMTAWWDRWLMGIPNGIENEPAVDVQFNDGTWHTEQSWPPAGTGELRLFMRPIAGAAGSLDTFAPEYTGETIFDDPSLSENRMLQNPDMADPSRLAYRTGPLKKPLRIAGRPVADLWASTDQTSTHFAVELVDVDAAGKWKIIDRGFGNARYRNGLELGQDLTPNQPYEFRIPILDNDYTFPAGHSVGVLVSASNAVWALPDPQRANNTILHGPHTPSSLVLQVVDAAQFGPRPTPASAGAGSGLPGTSTASIGAPHLVVPLVALVLAGILLLGATIAPRGRRRL